MLSCLGSNVAQSRTKALQLGQRTTGSGVRGGWEALRNAVYPMSSASGREPGFGQTDVQRSLRGTVP